MTKAGLIRRYVPEFDYNQNNDVFGKDAQSNNRATLKDFASELELLYASKKLYKITQYDLQFSTDSKVEFGLFHASSIEEVEKIMKEGFEKLYHGVVEDFCSNGTNQWISDKYSFGVMISEIQTDVFQEV